MPWLADKQTCSRKLRLRAVKFVRWHLRKIDNLNGFEQPSNAMRGDDSRSFIMIHRPNGQAVCMGAQHTLHTYVESATED